MPCLLYTVFIKKKFRLDLPEKIQIKLEISQSRFDENSNTEVQQFIHLNQVSYH